jgi:hypothetical protein
MNVSTSRTVSVHTMKTFGGVKVQLLAFVTSVLDGCEWSALFPDPFYPLERGQQCPLNRRLGGLPGPVSDDLEKRKLYTSVLPGIEARFHDYPACGLVIIPAALFRRTLC